MSQSPPTVGHVPADCDRIIIVGAGGFGREVLQWARHAWPEHGHKIAGFLSDDPTKLDGHVTRLPILGSPEAFEPKQKDYLILAIGIPLVRRRVAEELEARGARFLTMIHPTAIVADTAVIGPGTLVGPLVVISDSATIGMFGLLNYHASLGHDAAIGSFVVMSPYATLGGGASVADDVFLGIHASIGPNQKVGSRTYVSANTCVLRDAPEQSIVFGVPGRAVPRLEVNLR